MRVGGGLEEGWGRGHGSGARKRAFSSFGEERARAAGIFERKKTVFSLTPNFGARTARTNVKPRSFQRAILSVKKQCLR